MVGADGHVASLGVHLSCLRLQLGEKGRQGSQQIEGETAAPRAEDGACLPACPSVGGHLGVPAASLSPAGAGGVPTATSPSGSPHCEGRLLYPGPRAPGPALRASGSTLQVLSLGAVH